MKINSAGELSKYLLALSRENMIVHQQKSLRLSGSVVLRLELELRLQ